MSYTWVTLAICFILSTAHARYMPVRDALQTLQDTIVIENNVVKHRYAWNNGNLMLLEAVDKRSGKRLLIDQPLPDVVLPEGEVRTGATVRTFKNQANSFERQYTAVEICFTMGAVDIKRILKIYEDSPAVGHSFYYRGRSTRPYWEQNMKGGREMVEQRDTRNGVSPRIGIIPFSDKHWRFKVVSFREATDHHDNPVQVAEFLNYRQREQFSGNILVAENIGKELSFFILKESPIGYSQAFYPGFDFQADEHGLTIHGLGMSPTVLTNEWVRGYGYALGLTGKEAWQQSADLISYQKKLRQFVPTRDGMVLANTWGDRSKDSRMTEAFVLAEIEKAAELGITHLQLDDGWQQGLSRNSASKAGMKWDDWQREDWLPHPERFPRGLKPVIETAKENNVEICLWFNPSKENNYSLWERDADILIGFYNELGIRVFKIDGLSLANKTSEDNVGKLFRKVMDATGGTAVFNMDVTAGQRVGYHFFQEYGNVFLENRYTDWGNYYPYRTLRNLWLLSAYMPAERLQIEFLNVFRNRENYPEKDELSPYQAGLPYAFAVTMGAQPLAWMELTGLTEGGVSLSQIIDAYQSMASELHQSILLPIGDEPSGFSWTGFLAVTDDHARYLMVYREQHHNDTYMIELPIQAAGATFLFGDTPASYELAKDGNAFHITLSKPHQFAVFRLN